MAQQFSNNRIDQLFARQRTTGRKSLVAYVTAGDPHLEATEQLILELVKAGADLIEVGVPFSDPMADGPVIQAAGQRALASGTKLEGILEMVQRLRTQHGVTAPMILFSYYNIIANRGVEALADRSVEVGLDGWLVVDVPHEEQGEVRPVLAQRGLHSIPLIAPSTSDERAREILAAASGFVYCITVKGITGVRTELPPDLAGYLSRVSALTPLPVCAGFGISTPEMAAAVGKHAEGIVVGSALVRLVGENPDWKSGVAQAAGLVASMRRALDA